MSKSNKSNKRGGVARKVMSIEERAAVAARLKAGRERAAADRADMEAEKALAAKAAGACSCGCEECGKCNKCAAKVVEVVEVVGEDKGNDAAMVAAVVGGGPDAVGGGGGVVSGQGVGIGAWDEETGKLREGWGGKLRVVRANLAARNLAIVDVGGRPVAAMVKDGWAMRVGREYLFQVSLGTLRQRQWLVG